MARLSLMKATQLLATQHCQCQTSRLVLPIRFQPFSSSKFRSAEAVEVSVSSAIPKDVKSAPEIDFDTLSSNIRSRPARIIPASASYFTGAPQFNDNILQLRQLLRKYEYLPTVSQDKAPQHKWLKLAQFRSTVGEPVSAARYSQVLRVLQRLNRIHPDFQPKEVRTTMSIFLRPSSGTQNPSAPPTLDKYGRARGVGRRKESSAQVLLVEGNGEVLVNGRSIVDIFPRIHDRESALWALKVTERMNKYNVWAIARGGGVTGQAESITLAVARALIVHEPALKSVLRKAGCVTSDPRRVERKKPGRLKARKKPAWVKR
ncbi:putative 37s ribosomal protein s9 [Phaeomoniella chlamydospora]|uniref:Small ribosomal subunit protein uS9m n=1 Tax=Phaeomoniella chlamydospora TaxID=158046 RepID=A0A0G2GQ41_PHACM|nr:putative 37s ribosomal protein s9 [Phaeomoniella chlamydospora]